MGKIYKGDIKGDVVLKKGDDASKLTSVGGWLDISAEGIQLPVLTSVGGGLDISADARLVEVAKHALADHGSRLKMKTWHTKDAHGCETAHCVSGWAARTNGEYGIELEKKHGHPLVGNVLLGIEGSKLFFMPDDKARSALWKVLNDAGEQPYDLANAAS